MLFVNQGTYFFPPKAGFQEDVESQLVKNVRPKSLKEWEKFVIIVFDEMKIKEGHKYNNQLVGFVTLDDVPNCFVDLERKCSSSALAVTIATHMLVLMLRGVTIICASCLHSFQLMISLLISCILW